MLQRKGLFRVIKKCKSCNSFTWTSNLNEDRVCAICVGISAPDRNSLEVFGMNSKKGMVSLRIEGATIVLKELAEKKRETTIPIFNIQEFALSPSGGVNGTIKIATGKSSEGGFVGVAGGGGFIGFPLSSDWKISLVTPGEFEYAQNIQKYITEFQANASAPTSAPQFSVADELAKLKALLDDGVLTQEEFDRKKGKLLGD